MSRPLDNANLIIPHNVAPIVSIPVMFSHPVTIYIGTGGSITVKARNNIEVTYNNIANGTFLPIAINAITGGTVSDLVAQW